MNKKKNVDSGRKSARPDYIQKTISQKSSGKRSGKVFFPKTLIKTGGIIIFVLLLGFAGNKFFLSVSKTDSGKVKAVSASGADEEKEGRIIEKTKKTKEIKETKDVVEMKKTKEINFQPHCVDSTKPENLISYTNIEVDGNVLENIGDYKADGDISFNIGQDYTDVDGIVTFRGNSFRDTPSHGYADMTDFRLNNSLADYIYVTVAKTSDNASGVLACLRKSDGSKAWEDSSSYAWSSPVCVYNKDGSGKVLYCNSTGDICLLDGKTGKQEDVLSVSEGVIEASPAVYDNYAVVGTRDCKIWGIRLQ